MPPAKRGRVCSIQVLLDLGPLLSAAIRGVPARLCQVTYIHLDKQLSDERQRRRMMWGEEQVHATVDVDWVRQMRDLYVRFEKLQPWTLLVLDRRQRLTLRVLGQAQWAEVHLRERAVLQEALEWDHLLEYLILAQERVGRRWLKGQQGQGWAYLLVVARVRRSIIATQQQAESTLSSIARKERRYRRRLTKYILTELYAVDCHGGVFPRTP